ncbi:hypothetical protein BH10PSE6_BH10PSE6_37260 [soil metagenome]
MSFSSPLLTGAAICFVAFHVFKFFLDQHEDHQWWGATLAVVTLAACYGIGRLALHFAV